jgi:monovalent cation:H+ antiporter-2, CPA2 family
VVLLLFEVGIELDVAELSRERGTLFWAAPLQTVLTALAGTAAGLLLKLPLAGAVLLGLGIALSSSVVVVNITRSRRRTTDPATDHALLGWSVLQDVAGVALAIIALIGLGLQPSSGFQAAEQALLYVIIVVIATGLLPRLLRQLREEHDLFLIVSVASALALAGVGARFLASPSL